MLDFGFFELLMILGLCVVIVDTKDIPKVMAGIGRVMRRIQYVRFAMTKQFDEIVRAYEIDDLKDQVNFEMGYWEKPSRHTLPETDEADEDAVYFSGEGAFQPEMSHAEALAKETDPDSDKEKTL